MAALARCVALALALALALTTLTIQSAALEAGQEESSAPEAAVHDDWEAPTVKNTPESGTTPVAQEEAPQCSHRLCRWILDNDGFLFGVDLVEVVEVEAGVDGKIVMPPTEQTADSDGQHLKLTWVSTSSMPRGSTFLRVPAHLALGKHMEHFSRAADFLFYFRTKFTELHMEGLEGKELNPDTAKNLDRMALVLLLHFEQFEEGKRSQWSAFLDTLPRSLDHLPVAFTSAEQRVLAKFPMGGRTAVRYFQSTFTAAHYLANTVERARELKLYSPRFASAAADVNTTGNSAGEESQANLKAEAYVSSPEALTRTRQQILWAFVIVQELAADVPIDQDQKSAPVLIPGLDVSLHASAPEDPNVNATDSFKDWLVVVRDEGSPAAVFDFVASRDHTEGDIRTVGIQDGRSTKSCAVDLLLRYGLSGLPKAPLAAPAQPTDCINLQVGYRVFADEVAEANRLQALQDLGVDALVVPSDDPTVDPVLELTFHGSPRLGRAVADVFTILGLSASDLHVSSVVPSATLSSKQASSTKMALHFLRNAQAALEANYEAILQDKTISSPVFKALLLLHQSSERATKFAVEQLSPSASV